MKPKSQIEVITSTEQKDESAITLEAPLFVMFAEYFGYLSRFNNIAKEWCDGKVPNIMMQKVIILEANCILREMKKEYSNKTIRKYYELYYPIILQEYNEKLHSLIAKEK